jgi:hypothetical protein
MPTELPELDTREPRGIIIRTGAPRQAKTPFWAYLWSEEDGNGACAAPRLGPILESSPVADGLIHSWQASP